MYRGSVALGSFRLQKPYITLLLSKVSVISAKPPPATPAQSHFWKAAAQAGGASITWGCVCPTPDGGKRAKLQDESELTAANSIAALKIGVGVELALSLGGGFWV